MFRLKFLLAASGASLIFSHAALAFEGDYVGGERLERGLYSHELGIKKRADGRFDVEANVGHPGCSSSLDPVIGVAAGDTLTARGAQDGYKCTLVIRRTKKGVHVEEGDGCGDFHGAACEFTGDYRRKR